MGVSKRWMSWLTYTQKDGQHYSSHASKLVLKLLARLAPFLLGLKFRQTIQVRNFPIDRKSTRLNSSHVSTSYAVFCLKKKICTIKTSYAFITSQTMSSIVLISIAV